MPTQRTSRAGLHFWQYRDTAWHVPVIATTGQLDAANALGGLCVYPYAEHADLSPSGLNISISAGEYVKPNGQFATYAGTGTGGVAVPASATTYLWLDAAGALQQGTAYPTTGVYLPLAVVTAGATDLNVNGIADGRVPWGYAGDSSLLISETGAAAAMGVATLVAGTVTVANTRVTANTRIFLSVQSPGGTQGFLSVTRTAGTSFTITSTSGSDTSTVAWLLVEPTA